MTRTWTPEQKSAIEAVGNVLVNASAGSGKTAVLTEKVANLLANGEADASQILVVTFTKDAAREMADRIAGNLRERAEVLRGNPFAEKQEVERLEEQIRRLNTAAIQTFHSFCYSVVKKHYYMTPLDPNASLLPDIMATVLMNRAFDETADEYSLRYGDEFYDFIDYFGGLDQARRDILKLDAKISGFEDPAGWMRSVTEDYENGQSEKIEAFIENQMDQISERYRMIRQAMESEPSWSYSGKTVVESLMETAGNIAAKRKRGQTLTSDDTVFSDKRLVHGKYPEFIKEAIVDIRDMLRSLGPVDELRAEQQRRSKEMLPFVQMMMRFLQSLDERYAKAKARERFIQFSDMEHYALQILSNPDVAREYKDRFTHVFIDEYQDTNPSQETLISRIVRGDNLYCVGDMKQSIYRFRSADPSIFAGRNAAYTSDPKQGQVINLATNFRSAKNILDCANDVFSVLAESSHEITYGDADALRYGRGASEEEAEVVLSVLDCYGSTGWIQALEDPASSEELESLQVVKVIKEIVGKPIWTQSHGWRNCQYSDIAVLARNRSGFQSELIDALKNNDIPFALDKSGKLMDADEIRVFSRILMLADNWKDDVSVITLFHNQFFGLTDKDLIDLRHFRDKGDCLMTTVEKASHEETELGVKCRLVLRFVKRLRHMASFVSLHGALTYARDELEMDDYCVSLGDGKQRIANVETFIAKAGQVQSEGKRRMYDLMNALRMDENSRDRIGAAKVLAEGNCVKLVTIHGSKGLQYPVVIMPFLGNEMSKAEHDSIIVDENDGLATVYRSSSLDEEGESVARSWMIAKKAEASVEEEMRLLYVAMTRAEERLYLIGSNGGKFKELGMKERKFPENSYLKWLLSDTLRAYYNEDTETYTWDHGTDGKWKVEIIQPDIMRGRRHLSAPKKQRLTPDSYDVRRRLEELEQQDAREPFRVPVYISATCPDRLDELFTMDEDNADDDMTAVNVEAVHKGNAFHNVMEAIDLSRADCPEYVGEVARSVLSEEQMEQFKPEKVQVLMNSEIGQQIMNAQEVHRERRMQTMVPYSGYNKNYTGYKSTILICVVDMLYRWQGKWYLVDWKTDKFYSSPQDGARFQREVQKKAKRHAAQMDLYDQALRDCYGIQADDIYLGFAEAGVFYSVKTGTVC